MCLLFIFDQLIFALYFDCVSSLILIIIFIFCSIWISCVAAVLFDVIAFSYFTECAFSDQLRILHFITVNHICIIHFFRFLFLVSFYYLFKFVAHCCCTLRRSHTTCSYTTFEIVIEAFSVAVDSHMMSILWVVYYIVFQSLHIFENVSVFLIIYILYKYFTR